MREIVLDTETTGLYYDKGDRLIEIGAIELINHIPTGNTFHSYLNPLIKRQMSSEAFRVHGLTTEFLSNKPLFSEIVESLLTFLGQSKLIIHNAKFDIGFLNHELQLLENSNQMVYERLPYKVISYDTVIDTLEIAKKLYPGKSVSLDSLCIKFGINNKRKGKHGALIDSEILSEVYLELSGGKQPGFEFASPGAEKKDVIQNSLKKKKFIRRNPLNVTRLSEEEMRLHSEFISEIERNLWS
ncbi:MAG: DNA polymerase III subunit epsilon [Rhodobacteraceae bacterium]|nr:DNA polymerase III subunit epsilon [Paracoccaceae bacterium]|tara:strand:+ start:646 stop:1371 length:726 start_codon:yes stop_codon:yes gene_type:complete